jgi:phage terminase large subunit
MAEVKAAIASEPWLAAAYDVGEKYIRTRCGRVQFVFAGLRRNLDSIKSKARILVNWTDEAETVSEAAWIKLLPTLREEGPEGGGWHSENWVSLNPESPESATHRRFIAAPAADTIVTPINWRDNPWFPEVLDRQRRNDLEHRPDLYDHIWEGAFLSQTDALVFNGKFKVAEFDIDPAWDGPYQGVDFGFRPDPLAALRCYIGSNRVWITHEAYKAGVEIDAMPGFINTRIPDFAAHVARADSAEPKTISYAKRHGLPRMEAVKKWPNSVVEGVRFIRGFDCVMIHPRCEGTARDFRLYSHKIDRLTGDIMPDLVDANNHAPDALRYALAPLIKSTGSKKMVVRL